MNFLTFKFLLKIVNHPDYKPGKPIEGHDIAIYHVKPNKV